MSYPFPTQIPMIVDNLADQDAMVWSENLKAWTNGSAGIPPGTVAVATDGVTIAGTGLNASPLSVVADSVAINSSSSFTGQGTTASPLALAAVGTAQTLTAPNVTTNSSGQVTTTKISSQYTVSWSTNFNFTNSSETIITAASTNPSPADWITSVSPTAGGFTPSTGVYVCPVAGFYLAAGSIGWVQNSNGARFLNLYRKDFSSSQSSQISGSYIAGSVTSNQPCSHGFLCNQGDQITWTGYQSSGSSLIGTCYLTITLLHS